MTTIDFNSIPLWLIKKVGKDNSGFLACCIEDGRVGIMRETEKAYLVEVSNNFNTCKCAGWQFLVAKSLLK